DFHVTGVQTCALPISSDGKYYIEGASIATQSFEGDFDDGDVHTFKMTGSLNSANVYFDGVQKLSGIDFSYTNTTSSNNRNYVGRSTGSGSDFKGWIYEITNKGQSAIFDKDFSFIQMSGDQYSFVGDTKWDIDTTVNVISEPTGNFICDTIQLPA